MRNIECQFREWDESEEGPWCQTAMRRFDRCVDHSRIGEQDCPKAQQELHRREVLEKSAKGTL